MQKYTLCEFGKIPAPEGSQNRRWYRYVISNGVNVINGSRAGTEKEVAEFADNCVQQLNKKYILTRPHAFRPAYTHYPYELNI